MAAPLVDARLDDVQWLLPALWPDGDAEVSVGWASEGLRFVANPSPDDCRLLVPASPRRAASESVRRYHDGADTKQRLKMAATELLLRLGGSRRLARRGISITPASPGLVDHLGDELGTAIGAFAVTLGPRRANRKPVVQLFDENGSTVGFAKVGVDAYTDALVNRETWWLHRAAADTTGWLHVPTPLWDGEFGGHPVSVIAPSWAARRPRLGARSVERATLAPELLRAIHRLTPPTAAHLRCSAPALNLTASDRPEAEEALQLLDRALASDSTGEVVELGAWHGDLTPWNLLSTRAGRVVIDWETAEAGFPLGSDALQAAVASAMQLHGASAAEAVRRAFDGWPAHASELGLDRRQIAAARHVVLLEYVRRELDLEDEGRPTMGLLEPAIAELRGD